MNLTNKTTVPLFALIGMLFTAASLVSGHFLWIAAIATRAEVAIAKNIEQDGRLDRQNQFMQTQVMEQNKLLKEVGDRTARTETMVEILYKEDHKKR